MGLAATSGVKSEILKTGLSKFETWGASDSLRRKDPDFHISDSTDEVEFLRNFTDLENDSPYELASKKAVADALCKEKEGRTKADCQQLHTFHMRYKFFIEM